MGRFGLPTVFQIGGGKNRASAIKSGDEPVAAANPGSAEA
jgi:hypothetical protein